MVGAVGKMVWSVATTRDDLFGVETNYWLMKHGVILVHAPTRSQTYLLLIAAQLTLEFSLLPNALAYAAALVTTECIVTVDQSRVNSSLGSHLHQACVMLPDVESTATALQSTLGANFL